MTLALQFLATFSTAIFAGAAAYITLVEHPARMQCGIALAATEFGPSYRRAAVMQALSAAIAFLAAVGVWLENSRAMWLAGAIMIVAVIPFTLIVILPTNQKLLDPTLDRNSSLARELLTHWAKLHAVRTVLSLSALAILLLAR